MSVEAETIRGLARMRGDWERLADQLAEALDWIEAEPENPLIVQGRAREALEHYYKLKAPSGGLNKEQP